MKQRLLTLFTIVSMIAFSCGDEGVGFNAQKEISVDAPLSIPGPPAGIPVIGYDPPAVSSNETFDLSEVSEDLDDLGEVVINSISYEIIDVTTPVGLDELSLDIILNGTPVPFINESGTLSNTSKTTVNLTASQRQQLADQLLSQNSLSFQVTSDLSEVPDQNGINFSFRTYFDVTVKIRTDL
jgi:hypothetical protein